MDPTGAFSRRNAALVRNGDGVERPTHSQEEGKSCRYKTVMRRLLENPSSSGALVANGLTGSYAHAPASLLHARMAPQKPVSLGAYVRTLSGWLFVTHSCCGTCSQDIVASLQGLHGKANIYRPLCEKKSLFLVFRVSASIGESRGSRVFQLSRRVARCSLRMPSWVWLSIKRPLATPSLLAAAEPSHQITARHHHCPPNITSLPLLTFNRRIDQLPVKSPASHETFSRSFFLLG